MYLRRMAQILRIRKSDYLLFARNYGNRRSEKRGHYETLRISPTSTQKEIRAAYVKLSKEMHPDVSKKDSHKEFVAINEAYRVLSKEETKRQYDQSLHQSSHKFYDNYDPRRDYYNEWYQYGGYTSARRTNMYTRPETETEKQARHERSRRIALLCIVWMIIGTIFQVVLVDHSFTLKRDKMLEESRKLKLELEEIERSGLQRKTWDEKEAHFLAMYRKQQEDLKHTLLKKSE